MTISALSSPLSPLGDARGSGQPNCPPAPAGSGAGNDPLSAVFALTHDVDSLVTGALGSLPSLGSMQGGAFGAVGALQGGDGSVLASLLGGEAGTDGSGCPLDGTSTSITGVLA